VFKRGWGMTIVKFFIIIFRRRPYKSIHVDLGPSRIFGLCCFTLVPFLWVHTSLACIGTCHFVTMLPAIVIQGGCEGWARGAFCMATASTFCALFFEQCIDLLQGCCIIFQLLGQTGVVLRHLGQQLLLLPDLQKLPRIALPGHLRLLE
jgi:hypothetical protein